MTRFLNVLFLFSLTVILFACSEDDPIHNPLITKALVVQDLQLQDRSNADNPSDIEVRFQAPEQSSKVDRFGLFFAQTEDTALVTAKKIGKLSAKQRMIVKNDQQEYTVRLQAHQTDMLGKPFDASQSYVLYVASIGTYRRVPFIVTTSSTPFQLSEELLVETLVRDFPASDGLYVTDDGTIIASDFEAFDATSGIGLGTTVFAVTPEGAVSDKATGFVAPMGGGADRQGNFYFTHESAEGRHRHGHCESGGDGADGKVIRVSPDGSTIEIATLPGWPSGVAVDGNDNIYVANFTGPFLHKITPDGTISVVAQDNRLLGCVGIDTDGDGNIMTANFYDGSFYRVDVGTGAVTLIAKIPDLTEFFAIGYMTVFEGDIYATGIGENKIFKVTIDGQVNTLAGTGANGSRDGLLADATFSNPNGIAADTARRRLYISQFGERALRFIQF